MKDCAIVQQRKEKAAKRKMEHNQQRAEGGNLRSKASRPVLLSSVSDAGGEDEASLLAHEAIMRKEIQKVKPNWDIIDSNMRLTFAKRLRLIQQDHTLISDVVAAYPILKYDGEVCSAAQYSKRKVPNKALMEASLASPVTADIFMVSELMREKAVPGMFLHESVSTRLFCPSTCM